MATTNFKGQPVKLIGEFIQVGKVAPDFELVKSDLSSFALKDLKGKNIVLNIFPSLDTGVCATSVRKFNKMAAGMKDTVVLAISKDLPFAQGRFCTTEGIENVIPLSDFRFSDFDESYGVRMADGPLAGLLARAVVVIGKDGKVAYTELVPEITQEPDYEKALASVEKALKLAPDFASCYRLKGLCLVRQKRMDEACAAFSKAQELGDPLAARLIKSHCSGR